MNGPRLGKLADKAFVKKLKKGGGYEIIGREFERSIHSGGWPDFITRNPKGKLEFIEVKSGNSPLDHHQHHVLQILRKLGRVRVMRWNKKRSHFEDVTRFELNDKKMARKKFCSGCYPK